MQCQGQVKQAFAKYMEMALATFLHLEKTTLK